MESAITITVFSLDFIFLSIIIYFFKLYIIHYLICRTIIIILINLIIYQKTNNQENYYQTFNTLVFISNFVINIIIIGCYCFFNKYFDSWEDFKKLIYNPKLLFSIFLLIISAIFVQSADYSIFFPINIYFIPSIYKINNKILIERPEFFQVNIQNIQYKYKFNRLCFYGIGKTSFLKLLSGSYYNHKKHVYINNYDLSKYYYKNKLIIYKYHGVYDSLYNEILDLQKNNIIPLIDHSVLPYIQKYLHNIPAPIIITSDIPIDGFTNIELKHKI